MRFQRSVWQESVRRKRAQTWRPRYMPVTRATWGPEKICEHMTLADTGANGRSMTASFVQSIAAPGRVPPAGLHVRVLEARGGSDVPVGQTTMRR